MYPFLLKLVGFKSIKTGIDSAFFDIMKQIKKSAVLFSFVYLVSSIAYAEPPSPQLGGSIGATSPAPGGFEQTCALETSQHADLLNSVQNLIGQLILKQKLKIFLLANSSESK